jgi:hypothetical protein
MKEIAVSIHAIENFTPDILEGFYKFSINISIK